MFIASVRHTLRSVFAFSESDIFGMLVRLMMRLS